jgi:hypothetical protein
MHQRGHECRGRFGVLADDTARQRLLSKCRLDRALGFVTASPTCTGNPVPLPVTELERHALGAHLLETHQRLSELDGPAAETFRRIVEQLQREAQ